MRGSLVPEIRIFPKISALTIDAVGARSRMQGRAGRGRLGYVMDAQAATYYSSR